MALPVFCLVEVNYPLLTPQSELALFAALGVGWIFLSPPPASPRERAAAGWRARLGAAFEGPAATRLSAALLALCAALFAAVCLWVIVQTEPVFERWWAGGQSLGARAGAEVPLDVAAGVLGLVLVLIAARRALGWALPILALAFLAYAHWGAVLPDWLLPHRGYPWERLVGQTFLHSQGVFGVALQVMFAYVFPFLVFGALLEATGTTGYVLALSRRLFRHATGGPAKIAVLASGLMGSLSGSAVANTATTGTFTIPMMRAAGFRPETAAGLEAAASSGGALVPPVMGAGAYMMLEIIDPPVTYLQILQAALIPAVLYYLSLFLIVHFRAKRIEALPNATPAPSELPDSAPHHPSQGEEGRTGSRLFRWEALIFLSALATLLALLLTQATVFRAVTWSMATTLLLATLHPRTRLTPSTLLHTLRSASRGGVALVTAAAAVGVVIGVVSLTGVGTRLPAILLPLAQDNLPLALIAIMISSIILGLGLPSAVCYLLMATLIGPVLGHLGVPPLAAHLFIFYFGMMSMVTPPVALAAYAASSIAGSRLLPSSVAAFRFALIGFALPFLFVYRPELLMIGPGGALASAGSIVWAAALVAAGTVPLAAAAAGWLGRPLGAGARALLFAAAALALAPLAAWWINLVGLGLAGSLWWLGRRRSPAAGVAAA